MKATLGEVRSIVREVLKETPTKKNVVRLGGTSANIGGDGRYNDNLAVDLDKDTGVVTITVSSQGPVGGMDYDSGGKLYSPSVDWQQSTKPNAKPEDILNLLKIPLRNDNFNFKKYGKPTKNFVWYDGSEFKNVIGRGLNVGLVKNALAPHTLTNVRDKSASAPTQKSKVPATKMSTTEIAAEWDAMKPNERAEILQHPDWQHAEIAKLKNIQWSQLDIDDRIDLEYFLRNALQPIFTG